MIDIANSRQTAFDILLNIEKNCEYSNIGLDKALSTFTGEKRDRAFITNLVNGVCEKRITLDYTIKQCLSSPKTRLKANVRTILRMGACEILFFDGVPTHASVNEYVNMVKSVGAMYAVGLVNAVLRKIARDGIVLPNKTAPNYLSVKYSYPTETLQFLEHIFKEDTVKFLEASVHKPKIYGRVNTEKTDFDTLQNILSEEGIAVTASDILDQAFYFENSAAFMHTRAFHEGLFHIQDLSSQLCCAALKPEKGNRIIDVCAAPGGKTYTIAEIICNDGTVVSCDIHKHKIGLIKQGADRLGLSCVLPQLRDASTANQNKELFDRVLCDVPCSGYGVIRKKAEIKYKKPEMISELTKIQYAILENSAALLKPNGRLIYSTCTVTYEENEEIVKRFLCEHPEFSVDRTWKMSVGKKSEYGYRLSIIDDDCDSFFFAPLVREAST